MWPRQPRFDSGCGHAGTLQRYAAKWTACQLTGVDVWWWSRKRNPDWSTNSRCSGPPGHRWHRYHAQWIWKVFNFPGSLDTRWSSLSDMHLGARFKTTSSSGQDVALWPRQPRFDSWGGHAGCAAEIRGTDCLPDDRLRCLVWSRIRSPGWSAKLQMQRPVPSGSGGLRLFRCLLAPQSSQ